MNLFYLDENLDKCAEYHVDKHIVKMPLEAAQLLCTAIWVDEVLGFVPRALNREESAVLNEHKAKIGTTSYTISANDVQSSLHDMDSFFLRQF
jgi:hypothetical protein